jgi:hypothetical protein
LEIIINIEKTLMYIGYIVKCDDFYFKLC